MKVTPEMLKLVQDCMDKRGERLSVTSTDAVQIRNWLKTDEALARVALDGLCEELSKTEPKEGRVEALKLRYEAAEDKVMFSRALLVIAIL
jgi:hypothetical protein